MSLYTVYRYGSAGASIVALVRGLAGAVADVGAVAVVDAVALGEVVALRRVSVRVVKECSTFAVFASGSLR